MGDGRDAAPDVLLAGRYRLLRPVARRPCTTLWRGTDEVLARAVAVKVLDRPDALPQGTRAFLDAAVAAGRLTHPRIAGTYDAAEADGFVYVVSEWIDGVALVDLLRDGPLPAPRATTIAAQVAETVAYAHGRGVWHLDLDAHNVLVLPGGGGVKVTDFELGAVSCRPPGAAVPDADLPPELRDTRAVAALLYAGLTGRSATGAEPELPPAPRRDGRLLSPRQVRAAVPRDVDAVVVRVLRPDLLRHSAPITAADELLAALAPLPGEGGGAAPPPEPEPKPERRPRRWLRVGVPLLVVAGVGVAGLLAGLAIGRVPGSGPRFPGLGSTTGSAAPASGELVRPATVRDFDPQGDGEENPSQVPLATDGEVNTAWSTTTYFRSPAFGGLKTGAGLLVDLGRPVKVSSLRIAFAQPGVSFELRAADTPGDDIAGYSVVATVAQARRELRLTPRPGTTARYWVLWFTRLAPLESGKYGAGVAEFAFYR